jgi:hypothetical protein
MIVYPVTKMPEYFTELLRANMQSTGSMFNELGHYVSERPGFKSLVTRAFREIDDKANVNQIVKSLGWHGFRDRLAAMFIERQESESFSETVDLSKSLELIALEDDFKDLTVGGYSRVFMLAFYLRLTLINLELEGREGNHEDLLLDEGLKQLLLKYSSSRTIKLDYALLTFKHFYRYLGADQFESCLANKVSYEECLSRLSHRQSENLTSNLLSYGCSIGEHTFFYSEVI